MQSALSDKSWQRNMSLSKEKSFSVAPFVFQLVGKYFQQLYMHPIRTKSITSCVVASLGNLTSQCLYSRGKIDKNSLEAFALFGLLFGGTVPHGFYKILESIAPGDSVSASILRFLIERFIYTPLFQLLSLYSVSVFEDNWKYLSLFQFINVTFVPPMLRVLFGNLLGFFWCIYVARRRKLLAERRGGNVP
ncbi:hypothetical protein B566_EDAN012267 [Ephemera danica]|nr:hypothetical protein B566_EDAN012267 [Ephemera danica]